MGTTRWTGHRLPTALAVLISALLAGCTTPTGPTPSSSPPTGATATPVTSTSRTALSPTATASTAPSTADWPAGVVTPFRTTEPGSATGKRIGLISPDATDPFSRAVTDSIIAETTTAGAALIRCDPGADGEFALECAQRLANQQVDGWIVQRSGWIGGSSLCGAGPRQVPMIVVDGPPGSCTTATVTADDRAAGRLAGEHLGEYSRSDHDCRFDSFLLITDPTERASAAARAEGIREGFRQSCPDRLEVPFTTAPTTAGSMVSPTPTPTTTNPSQQSASSSAAAERARVTVVDTADQKAVYDAVQRVIGTHPDSGRILIAAVSDGPAFTAMTAVRSAGRLEDVRLVAVGADQRSRCEIARNPRWLGDAALFPDRYGELVVPSLVDAMAGRSIPQAMLTSPQFLDASTVSGSYDVSSCPESP